MPALPKHPSTRARRNRAAGARTLTVVHDIEVPALPEVPDFEWHHMTADWWDDIWASPMAPEYDGSDVHGLFILAMLVDQFWTQPSAALAGEIRLQRQCFGLTPIDRRRLQWEIDRGEEASTSTQKRRNEQKVQQARDAAPPAPSAGKPKWIEWVVANRNVPHAQLEAMSKADIVRRYGTSKADPRDQLA